MLTSKIITTHLDRVQNSQILRLELVRIKPSSTEREISRSNSVRLRDPNAARITSLTPSASQNTTCRTKLKGLFLYGFHGFLKINFRGMGVVSPQWQYINAQSDNLWQYQFPNTSHQIVLPSIPECRTRHSMYCTDE